MVVFTSGNVMKSTSGLLARRRIDDKGKVTVRTGSCDTGRQSGRCPTHRERSSTIQVAPRFSISLRAWLVQTANTRAPDATPERIPEGASSTTIPRFQLKSPMDLGAFQTTTRLIWQRFQ